MFRSIIVKGSTNRIWIYTFWSQRNAVSSTDLYFVLFSRFALFSKELAGQHEVSIVLFLVLHVM